MFKIYPTIPRVSYSKNFPFDFIVTILMTVRAEAVVPTEEVATRTRAPSSAGLMPGMVEALTGVDGIGMALMTPSSLTKISVIYPNLKRIFTTNTQMLLGVHKTR